jgi:two-component system heavy metal sensor histidine kinase CusS
MIRLSLTSRLALLLAASSFAIAAAVGWAMYRALEIQLVARDDAALLTRVEQIRTLLKDVDLLDMIHRKPQLFGNMLGNREALLILRYPGRQPLIEVNPGRTAVPEALPQGPEAALTFADVRHSSDAGGTPFILVTATVRTSGDTQPLQIVSGRLLAERTRMLEAYRDEIAIVALAAALLAALLTFVFVRRGLRPLRELARRTASIGIRNLSTRLDDTQAPSELLPLVLSFNGMLDRLETSFAQLSQVSADMAHDLRTPIATLLGRTEVALTQRRNIDYYEHLLGSNFEELQRLSTMTDNMLFLARAEHADHTPDLRTLDVADELARIADYFDGLAQERGLRLTVHGGGDVSADPMLLRRALANLVANAVRHADSGTQIRICAQQDGDATSISVENVGATISPHHLPRLFDRFYRADAARGNSSDSNGLGLAIVRGIMTLHQGAWSASSELGVTRFTIVFPSRRFAA